MKHHRRSACLLATAACLAVLTACGSTAHPHPAPTATAATAAAVASKPTEDPATTARGAQFSRIVADMSRAMSAAGLDAATEENAHPTGSLTSAKYCLNSYILFVPASGAAQVAAALDASMTADGWKTDTNAAQGSTILNQGEWTLTIAHQDSGTNVDPITKTVRNGPLSFFTARNNSFDCG